MPTGWTMAPPSVLDLARMSSPSSRLRRRYRVMWNDDGGTASHYHPPLSPERFKQIQLGYLHGYPVDAYLTPRISAPDVTPRVRCRAETV